MQSTSRRAFLGGRRMASTPWGQFCQRVRRTVQGEFAEFRIDGSAGSARLTLEQAGDIHHVRALCEQYDVVLALDGLALPSRPRDLPVVWVRPGKGLSRLQPVEAGSSQWFVQPGCTLGQLAQAGLHQFSLLPAHVSVASWLADRSLVDYASGRTAASGLLHASLVLGDGEVVTLGPFGRDNRRALQGLRLQQLVPALFRLAAREDWRAGLQSDLWPGRYRLDVLMQGDADINLAQLCLGHGGDLGWVQWVVLDANAPGNLEDGAQARQYYSQEAVEEAGFGALAMDLDWEVKALFDPQRVLSDPGQQL